VAHVVQVQLGGVAVINEAGGVVLAGVQEERARAPAYVARLVARAIGARQGDAAGTAVGVATGRPVGGFGEARAADALREGSLNEQAPVGGIDHPLGIERLRVRVVVGVGLPDGAVDAGARGGLQAHVGRVGE